MPLTDQKESLTMIIPERVSLLDQLSKINILGKNIKLKQILTLVLLTLSLSFTLALTQQSQDIRRSARGKYTTPTTPTIPRGISGDFYADLILGKRDITEFSPRDIVASKVFNPNGVIVDMSVSPGIAYVWDSGNSRILGINLANCYNSSSPCEADIVIGQPSLDDYGACNQDSSFQYFPDKAPSSNSTLCGIPEWTHTTLEDKSFANMYVDEEGNLYVPDSYNHRILKYNRPYHTDQIADEVWGQADFTGNKCNGNGMYGVVPNAPTAETLCFHSTPSNGGGVGFDLSGNMWVADGGNNRVLRYPRNANGRISKVADLVLGQPDFTTGGDWSFGSGLDEMSSPRAVAFDPEGNLYVADDGNNRVLKFSEPFVSGMPASSTFGSDFSSMFNVQMDPQSRGLWTIDNFVWDSRFRLWDFQGNVLEDFRYSHQSGGSLGFDTEGRILFTSRVYGQNLIVYEPDSSGSYSLYKEIFSPPYGYNLISNKRLEHHSWQSIALDGRNIFLNDSRLIYWSRDNLYNGKPFDGFLIGSNDFIPEDKMGQIEYANNYLWITQKDKILIYPPIGSRAPVRAITSVPTLPTIKADTTDVLTISDAQGIAPTPDGKYVWVSEPQKMRVFRIRDPLSNPVIDVILGQNNISDTYCNHDPSHPANTNPWAFASGPTLDSLCWPGSLALDNFGNLFVSDHIVESAGNFRILMFNKDLFPDNSSYITLAPLATKEFPRKSATNNQSHAVFGMAFDSTNRMVVGYNPYDGPRFLEYYNNPTSYNPSNPSDPSYALPDGQFNDFYNWATDLTFDENDNLYVIDANRGQLRIYYQPFVVSDPTPTASSPSRGKKK